MTRPRTRAARVIRSDGWTLPRQRQFLKMLAVTGSVDKACVAANMSVSSAYRLRLHPDGAAFRNAWAAALGASAASIREIALERAINGTTEPVIENGAIVGRRTVFNDRLLMFMLKRYDNSGGAAATDYLVNSFIRLEAVNVPDAEMVEDPEDAPEAGTGFASN